MTGNLDPQDQIKLDTWYHLTTLLDDYHLLAFDPIYQRDQERREEKRRAVMASRDRLVARWQAALGPKWRDALLQQD
ncbi:hypothetical protein [Bradyrhizobium glycinis]|uniref:hypothetical protein n=1 Tax=Bradyrhizobium glycinis TaxID=2751812 RepID=UPI0018D89BBB|nr:hypothetical protein [Bradyrhizobium glycinis]MBH5372818.1 hypothetical protein [Bradyrhizobium glycinis]